MIVVADYGLGNLASVRNALRRVGADVLVSAEPEALERADGIVLPGVGSAAAGMTRIRERGLEDPLRRAASVTPLLGLCLGMQLLFECSEEGDAACLGLIPGKVRRIRGTVKVPQIGWNEVESQRESPLFAGLPPRPYFYFVHSYVCVPEQDDVVVGTTEYGESFCSAVAHGSIWGTQFHPERSGDAGLALIRNFVEVCDSRDSHHLDAAQKTR